jgi:16S rRNA (uracil1498-N3)-methyltransferase
MVERQDRPPVAQFLASEHFRVGSAVTLNEESAHHARVARVGLGERVAVTDGAGALGRGILIKISKSYALVEVESVEQIPSPRPIHVLAPIGDRDRMLLLAEKCVEIGIASWRPVFWRRSRSVSPRGEGPSFAAKTRARMVSALLQSRGAWLPDCFPDSPPERAIAACPTGARILLDVSGGSLALTVQTPTATIALGPEGGLEPEERDQLLSADFLPVSLGPSVLRFETAGIVSVGLASIQLRGPKLANAARSRLE